MEQKILNRPVRVGLISLGCAKNLVDSEIMLGSLLQSGMEIINDPGKADAIIINTCSFIDSAQEESVDTILQSAQLRDARNPNQTVIVSGCLPQRFREELPKLMPEVDAFMGIDQVARAGEIVREAVLRRRNLGGDPQTLTLSPKGERRKGGDRSKVLRTLAGADALRAEMARGPDRLKAELHAHAAEPMFEVTARPNYIPDYATPRFRLTPRHFTYVKIAEGCNHPCSFCIIPRMRGGHRSRLQHDIVTEARQLISEGVKELNLISQDTTFYGMDTRRRSSADLPASRSISAPENFRAAARALPHGAETICTLLRELNEIPGEFWVRLLYTHPAHWTDELIQTIAECPKVARYVDMPLQHIHPVMLERMRRETSHEYIRDLITRIRAGVPGIAIRTTFIVGFPGETEDIFENLLEFIRETRFERLGVFGYSQEEGTKAGRMGQQLPAKTKTERRNRAMAEQHRIARAVSQSFVGKTLKVLIESEANTRELQKANIHSWEHGFLRERPRGGAAAPPYRASRYLIGRSEADAPDIDGRVYVRGRLPIGHFTQVKIIGHTDYDLIAQSAY